MNVTPLKLEIVKSGMLIKDVSEKSGVNNNYVSAACNGRIKLKRHHQNAIARVLKKPVSEIFPEAA